MPSTVLGWLAGARSGQRVVKEVRATASAPDEVTRLRRGANQTGAADLSVIMTAYEEQEIRGRDPTERPVRSGAGVRAG